MQWFKTLFGQKVDKKEISEYTFSDDDRQKSLRTRLENRALRLKEQELDHLERMQRARQLDEQIEMMRSNMYDDDDDDDEGDDMVESALSKLISPLIQNLSGGNNQSTPLQTMSSVTPESPISEEDLKEIVAEIKENTPRYKIALFKSMPKDKQISIVKSRYPELDEKIIEKAIQMV